MPTRRRPHRLTALAAVLAVVAAGCGSGSPSATKAPATTASPPTTVMASTTAPSLTTDPTTTTAPPPTTVVTVPAALTRTYAKAPCDDVVPADPRIECGTLTVPMDRTAPRKGNVTLPVAIIHPKAGAAPADPIVYFSGGPGFDGRSIARRLIEEGVGAERDVVLFDQRGTGASTPSLDCPETVVAVQAALGSGADALAEGIVTAKAQLTCRDRLLAAGVDLTTYNTPTIAADADDLRIALGIARWNVFGVSYGTRLAQEYVRRYGASVRAVVLDSNLPPDRASDGPSLVASAQRVLSVLERGCSSSPTCAAHGDFAKNLDAVIAQWDARPFEAMVEDPSTHENHPLAITGSDVVAGLFNALYDSSLVGILPSLLPGLLARGDVAKAVVNQLAADGVRRLTGYAEAMGTSVDCADTERVSGPGPLAAAASADPRWRSLLTLGGVPSCADWGVPAVDPSFNTPVVSDVPALVFGDDYDPVTPPSDSERVAQGFSHGTFVFMPGLGHGAVFADSCAVRIFQAFIADPTASPDRSCTAQLAATQPAWA